MIQLWLRKGGNFQLAEIFHYDNAGQDLEFQQSDYEEILKALKWAKPDTKMTEKVAKTEEELRMAKRSTLKLE